MDLTNREVASLIWLALVCATVCAMPVFRRAVPVILKVMFAGPILAVLISALVYIALCLIALERVGLWGIENFKTTLLWVASFALLSVLDFKRLMEERLFFRTAVCEILSVTVILLFLVETYTLSLLAELLVVPVATLLAIIQAMPAKKAEEQTLKSLAGGLLAIIGLGYLAYSGYQALVSWREFATLSTARDFGVPVLLSLMFLPFLYGLRLYATYESVFAGLNLALPDAKLRRYARVRAIVRFRTHLDHLKRWRRIMLIEHPKTKADIQRAFAELARIRQIEKSPPAIPLEEGWSPYAAKQFLQSEGFITDDYHRSFDDQWRCQSAGVKAQEDTFAPTATYVVTGNDRSAIELTLDLNVFNCENPAVADQKFWLWCGMLLTRALPAEHAQAMVVAIGEAETAAAHSGYWEIQLTREEHPSAIGTSYDRSFSVRSTWPSLCNPQPN